MPVPGVTPELIPIHHTFYFWVALVIFLCALGWGMGAGLRQLIGLAAEIWTKRSTTKIILNDIESGASKIVLPVVPCVDHKQVVEGIIEVHVKMDQFNELLKEVKIGQRGVQRTFSEIMKVLALQYLKEEREKTPDDRQNIGC